MDRCKRFFVSGRVQGVFFRASTRDTARRLGLCGFVRNLADGRVEIVACGDPSRLLELEEWLWRGPPYARVSDVVSEDVSERTYVDFEAR